MKVLGDGRREIFFDGAWEDVAYVPVDGGGLICHILAMLKVSFVALDGSVEVVSSSRRGRND